MLPSIFHPKPTASTSHACTHAPSPARLHTRTRARHTHMARIACTHARTHETDGALVDCAGSLCAATRHQPAHMSRHRSYAMHVPTHTYLCMHTHDHSCRRRDLQLLEQWPHPEPCAIEHIHLHAHKQYLHAVCPVHAYVCAEQCGRVKHACIMRVCAVRVCNVCVRACVRAVCTRMHARARACVRVCVCTQVDTESLIGRSELMS